VAGLVAPRAALAHNEGVPPMNLGDLEEMCGPLPAPTPSPTATRPPTSTPTATSTLPATVTPSVTPSPSPTSPARPTPTATRPPKPLYLPLTLDERCDPARQRVDVALVLDTSSSMAGQKLADARDAASAFVALMGLAAGGDQVAVVRFDTSAEVLQPLTHDPSLAVAALGRLVPRQGTHIDEGLRAALAELTSTRRRAANLPVAVLLTDGIHAGAPGADVAAATALRGAGVRLYAIGLGADVDAASLEAMAPGRVLLAPDSSALGRVYSEVARDITCPDEALWPH
jgi:uncharacterized protein YegL